MKQTYLHMSAHRHTTCSKSLENEQQSLWGCFLTQMVTHPWEHDQAGPMSGRTALSLRNKENLCWAPKLLGYTTCPCIDPTIRPRELSAPKHKSQLSNKKWAEGCCALSRRLYIPQRSVMSKMSNTGKSTHFHRINGEVTCLCLTGK